MNKKVLITLVLAAIAGIAAVVVFANPFDSNGHSPNGNGNSTPTNNTTPEQAIGETTGISPGKFFIDNMVPGVTAEMQLNIHNGQDVPVEFTVDYRVPDFVAENYSRPTEPVRDWVYISNRRPTILAHETYIVTISLGMPSNVPPPSDKWEFWIGVIDQSQTGWIQSELCCRFMVTMA